jgi:hypothetical protein
MEEEEVLVMIEDEERRAMSLRRVPKQFLYNPPTILITDWKD